MRGTFCGSGTIAPAKPSWLLETILTGFGAMKGVLAGEDPDFEAPGSPDRR